MSQSSKKRSVFIVPSFILFFIGIYWFSSISSENAGQVDDTEKLPIDFIGTDLSGNIFQGISLKVKQYYLIFGLSGALPVSMRFLN